MNRIQLWILLGVALFATGCPKYRPQVDFNNEASFRSKINAHLANEQKRYQCYRDGMNYQENNDVISCTGTVSDGEAKARIIRNELLSDALSYIDDAYGDFKNGLAAGRDRTNFVADLVELGTSAAIGITNGERPLQILGIALTAFRGGRKSADANFYKDQSTPILISKMDGNRARVRALIEERKKKDTVSYAIGDAISDIVEYYNAGTLVEAFVKLSEDTAVQTKQAEAELTELKRRAGVLLAPTEDEIRISRENSTALDALAEAYDDAASKVDDAETAETDATTEINAANQRIAAAEQIITVENGKPTPDLNVIAKANEEKAKGVNDKAKAEGDKLAATNAKTAAIAARTAALANLKGTYDAVEGDPALTLLLDKIPDLPGYSAGFKARLVASLQRLKQSAGTPDDYVIILRQVNKVVRLNLSHDPTLNERMQKILNVNQKEKASG